MEESPRSSQSIRRISFDSVVENFRRSRRSVSVSERSDESNQSYRSRKVSLPTPSARRSSGASFFTFKKHGEQKRETVPRLENTYRLEPKATFPEGKIRQLITETLGTLKSHTYDPMHSPFQAKLLSSRLLDQVKQIHIDRYKLVCLVTIASKANQGMEIASRCLWNAEFDTFVSVKFEGNQFFAIATVYGIYYEWCFWPLEYWGTTL